MIFENLKLNKRVPTKIQMNQYDCGPTCLQMILAYNGYNINFSKIKENFSSIGNSRDGTSMFKIKQVAEAYKLKCIAKKAKYNKLDNTFLPIVVFWENKHYVILEKISKSGYIINDPMIGRVKVSKEEFNQKYSNIFLVMYPTEEFTPTSENKYSKLNYFKNVIIKNKKYFILSIMIALLLQLISLVVPILTQNLIDSFVSAKNYSIFSIILIAILGTSIFQVLFTYFKGSCIVKLQKELDDGLTSKFLSHMLKLPYKYFESRSKGDLIMRINSNHEIREILSQKLISTIINLFLVIITFAYIYYKSSLVALSLLVIGIVQLIVFFFSKNHIESLTKSEIMAQTSVGSFMTEVLEGICTVKSLGIEEVINSKWKKLFKKQLNAVQDKSYFQIKIDTLNNSLLTFCPVIILFLGIYQISKNQMSIGTLFAFQTLSVSFLSPLNSLAVMINDLVMVDSLLERIYDVINSEPEPIGKIEDVNLKGDITIKDVYFKYSDYTDYSLKNINMKIKAGEKIAIVGKSGSGKSTLAKLIVGLYKPTKGKIYFDDYETRLLNKKYLRKKIGMVLQENFLFNKTIYDNLIINHEKATMDEVLTACKIAEIDKDIEKMPMQYNTIISECGNNLSGGQKQRIALARAVVNKPKILLLDEATSALDTVTESAIQENLESINCTQVIIAHRLSTIINSDTIFVVDDGKIIDSGNHRELIERCDFYRKLYNSKVGA